MPLPTTAEWIPQVGQRVRLSAEGYAEGLIFSPEAAEAAKGMNIIGVEQMGPDAWAIDVDGPLGIFCLHNGTLELVP